MVPNKFIQMMKGRICDRLGIDNFQFVELDSVVRECRDAPATLDITFAVKALMEVPEQFLAIRKLGML